MNYNETEVTVKFRMRTFKVARYRVRKEIEEKNANGAESNPAAGTMDLWGGFPLGDLGEGGY